MAQGALPGFRDFYPEQFAERDYLMKVWRTVARKYAFVEYDGPPLEPLELYTKKSGDEIVGQLYNFRDKGDREVALRPEMTPTLARMVGAKANALRKPVRWFSIPQLFRYERQQRGRLREHFQLNVDIVGEADVTADAELLAVAIDVMRELGLTPDDVRARVSDRRLLHAILPTFGVREDQVLDVMGIMDKAERDPTDVTRERLSKVIRDSKVAEDVATFIESIESTYGDIDEVFNHFLRKEVVSVAEPLKRYFGYLESLGVRDYAHLDLRIVRGLAYYTGIVFELFDMKGGLRAICGGGRYDTLLGSLGGAELPALGFGMGDVVLTELLRERGLNATVASPDFWIASVADDAMPDVMASATILRRAGASVEYALRKQQVGKQRKAAMSAGASYFVTLAADFARSGNVEVAPLFSPAAASVNAELALPPLMFHLANRPSTLDSLVAVVRERPNVLA